MPATHTLVCTFPTMFGNSTCQREVQLAPGELSEGCGLPGHTATYLSPRSRLTPPPTVADALADVAAAMTEVPSPAVSQLNPAPLATRHRLSPERRSVTRTFRLRYVHKDGTPDEMEMYVTVGTYDDGRIGEIFITTDRMGSFARGAIDAAATMMSLMLQYGVPLHVITGKLRHARFEPAGFTGDPEFPSCTSPLDLLAQWLDRRFGS